MNEVLVPYTEFDATDLALQLSESVRSNLWTLAQRNFHGVIARYGWSLDIAEVMVKKGQRDHLDQNPLHYAVMGYEGDVVGAASIYSNLPLHKLHLPFVPKLTHGRLAEQFPYANPNISAWTEDGEEDALTEAYRQMAEMSLQPVPSDAYLPHESPWTIEPTRSNRDIHTAIILAGLTKVVSGHFDDTETKTLIPPRSTLYAKLNGKWRTAHGKQKELRKGQSVRRVDIGQPEDDELEGAESGYY